MVDSGVSGVYIPATIAKAANEQKAKMIEKEAAGSDVTRQEYMKLKEVEAQLEQTKIGATYSKGMNPLSKADKWMMKVPFGSLGVGMAQTAHRFSKDYSDAGVAELRGIEAQEELVKAQREKFEAAQKKQSSGATTGTAKDIVKAEQELRQIWEKKSKAQEDLWKARDELGIAEGKGFFNLKGSPKEIKEAQDAVFAAEKTMKNLTKESQAKGKKIRGLKKTQKEEGELAEAQAAFAKGSMTHEQVLGKAESQGALYRGVSGGKEMMEGVMGKNKESAIANLVERGRIKGEEISPEEAKEIIEKAGSLEGDDLDSYIRKLGTGKLDDKDKLMDKKGGLDASSMSAVRGFSKVQSQQKAVYDKYVGDQQHILKYKDEDAIKKAELVSHYGSEEAATKAQAGYDQEQEKKRKAAEEEKERQKTVGWSFTRKYRDSMESSKKQIDQQMADDRSQGKVGSRRALDQEAHKTALEEAHEYASLNAGAPVTMEEAKDLGKQYVANEKAEKKKRKTDRNKQKAMSLGQEFTEAYKTAMPVAREAVQAEWEKKGTKGSKAGFEADVKKKALEQARQSVSDSTGEKITTGLGVRAARYYAKQKKAEEAGEAGEAGEAPLAAQEMEEKKEAHLLRTMRQSMGARTGQSSEKIEKLMTSDLVKQGAWDNFTPETRKKMQDRIKKASQLDYQSGSALSDEHSGQIASQAYGNQGHTSAAAEKGFEATQAQQATFQSPEFQQQMSETYGTGGEGSLMAGGGPGGFGGGGLVKVTVFLSSELTGQLETNGAVVGELVRAS